MRPLPQRIFLYLLALAGLVLWVPANARGILAGLDAAQERRELGPASSIELPIALHYEFLQDQEEGEPTSFWESNRETLLVGASILIMLGLAVLLYRRRVNSISARPPRERLETPAPTPVGEPKPATLALEPAARIPEESFHVFLSYNRQDERVVLELAEILKKRGLRAWLDQWELIPGHRWQEAIEAAMSHIDSAAVLVGSTGIGPWQNREMRACLDDFLARDLPVIPVLLPGVTTIPELPPFLRAFTWVDLRGGLTEAGIARLIWGITGQKPASI